MDIEIYVVQIYDNHKLLSETKLSMPPWAAELQVKEVFFEVLKSKNPLKLVVSNLTFDPIDVVEVTNNAYNMMTK